MTLEADEFQRRFLMHTLPAGFPRIRHYGLLANCHRADKPEYCRRLLTAGATGLLPSSAECAAMQEALTEPDTLHRCPQCGVGSMIRIAVLPCYRWPAIPPDTS